MTAQRPAALHGSCACRMASSHEPARQPACLGRRRRQAFLHATPNPSAHLPFSFSHCNIMGNSPCAAGSEESRAALSSSSSSSRAASRRRRDAAPQHDEPVPPQWQQPHHRAVPSGLAAHENKNIALRQPPCSDISHSPMQAALLSLALSKVYLRASPAARAAYERLGREQQPCECGDEGSLMDVMCAVAITGPALRRRGGGVPCAVAAAGVQLSPATTPQKPSYSYKAGAPGSDGADLIVEPPVDGEEAVAAVPRAESTGTTPAPGAVTLLSRTQSPPWTPESQRERRQEFAKGIGARRRCLDE
jgi:hypothetical protein